jgi:hypothetical protein
MGERRPDQLPGCFRTAGWLFLLFCVVPLTVIYVLHRNSFCMEKGKWRFMTNTEIIDAAIEDELQFLKRSMRFAPAHIFLPFKDATEFRLLNPECCHVLKSFTDEKPTITRWHLDTLVGIQASAVRLNYLYWSSEQDGSIVQRRATPILVMDSCTGSGDSEGDARGRNLYGL